jgi:P4 family phage/plasmid primase-like protien
MSHPFRNNADDFWNTGLSVIPLEPRSKEPAKELRGWPGYLGNPPKPETRQDWRDRLGHCGIGLLLGDEVVAAQILIAIDVDDDLYVPVVEALLEGCVSSKFGKKGRTFFALAFKAPKFRSTQLRDDEKQGKIDILAAGKMTVLPPSLHPETASPYTWIGQPLPQCDFAKLPFFDEMKLKLPRIVVASPHTKTIATGETTHDAAVALTAQLVAVGAPDDQIEAIFRALLPASYDGNTLIELPGLIESARRKGFEQAAAGALDDRIARTIEEELKPIVYVPGDGFLHYRDGFWSKLSDSAADRRAKELLAEMTTGLVGPLLRHVRKCLELNVESEEFGNTLGLICTRNGTVDVKTGKLEPHSPDHHLRYRLDFDYDPLARCPVYEEHLKQTLDGNEGSIQLFEEFAAHTLVEEMRFQKALYLMGKGGSGKSTLLRVVEMLHDPRAVSTTPLVKVEEERYLTDLVRKLVCISFDVQTDRKVFGENFIRITGGDPVATRRLYKEVQGRVVPTVRFMGSMNEDMPRFIAAPDAVERRLIILRCGERVATIDRQRGDKLRAELPGILVRMVRALQRLYARDGFDIPEESLLEVEDYVHTQDSFDLFVGEKLVRDPRARTSIATIAREYNWWAEQMGAEHLKVNVIGRKLRRAGFEGSFARMPVGDGTQNQRIVHARIRGNGQRLRPEDEERF